MSYAVIAERHGLSIYTRAPNASDALARAVERRQSGAVAVFVRDAAWGLVPAGDLERIAEREQAARGASNLARPVTFTVGRNTAAAPAEAEPASTRSGRVRVFKAGGTPRR